MPTKKASVEVAPIDSAAALAAAENSLREAEQRSAHYREIEARFQENPDPDADRETMAGITEARTRIEAADRKIEILESELEQARAIHAATIRREAAERYRYDPLLTGEAEQAAVGRYVSAIESARSRFTADYDAIVTAEKTAAAQAAAEGFRVVDRGNVFGSLAVNDGEAVVAVRGLGIALPGKAYIMREGATKAMAKIDAGKYRVHPLPAPEPVEDAVSAEDAELARRLLSEAYGAPVAPLAAYDPFGTETGAWSRIDLVDGPSPEGRVGISAVVKLRRVGAVRNVTTRDDPRPAGSVIVWQWSGGPDGTIEATVIDPSLNTAGIDPADVGRSVTAALARVGVDDWPQTISHLIMRDWRIYTHRPTINEDGTVRVSFGLTRDRVTQPVTLPGSILAATLTGLPIATAGVVKSVTIDNGSAVLTF